MSVLLCVCGVRAGVLTSLLAAVGAQPEGEEK